MRRAGGRGDHCLPGFLFLIVVSLSVPATGAAQSTIGIPEIVNKTSGTYFEEVLARLTGEIPVWIDGEEARINTRLSGSEDGALATRLLEEEFGRLGLEVRRQEYLGSILEDIGAAGSHTKWAVGHQGVILRTEDGGASWSRQEEMDEHLYGVAVLSAQSARIAANRGIVYRTGDGGRTWESVQTPARRLRGIAFLDSLSGWACGMGEGGGIVLRTRDGGLSWVGTVIPASGEIYAVTFADTSRGWAAGKDGHVFRTENGGAGWDAVVMDGEPDLHAVCFVDSLRGWIAGEGGVVMATTDGGISWIPAHVDTAVTLYDLEFEDQHRGWACGEGGLLFETTDGGSAWTVTDPGLPADLRAMVLDGDGAWIVGDYTILQSTDRLHWERQEAGVEGLWTNVEATLTGTVTPEESIVLCGHFDSISEVSGLRAPGAVDNGTGTALVLTAARTLSAYRFEKTLRFVCFSGEEQGLRGSFNYVGELQRSGALPEVAVNADMVGWDAGHEQEVWILPGEGADSRPLAEACSTWVEDYVPGLVPAISVASYGDSDHSSFSRAGVPAVMLSEGAPVDYPYIHTVADEFDRVNLAFAREVTQLAVAALAALAVPVETGPVPSKPLALVSGIWPNPSSHSTAVRFVVPGQDPARVTLRLYDVTGRLVRVLTDQDWSPGVQEVRWDGEDGDGNPVSPGLFFVRLNTGGRTDTAKLLRVE